MNGGLRVALLMLSGLAGLGACGARATKADTPAWRRLRPESAVFAINSGYVAPAQQVIRTADEWRSAWAQLQAPARPVSPPPTVDFKRESVIVVALGRQRSGGHAIRIVGIETRGRSTVIRVRAESPGRGCIVMSALTSPADVAVISAVVTDPIFEVARVSVDCGVDPPMPAGTAERETST